MSKASGNGYYTTTDEAGRVHRFVVRKGDTIPDGAAFVAGEQDAPAEAASVDRATVTADPRKPAETSAADGPKAKS